MFKNHNELYFLCDTYLKKKRKILLILIDDLLRIKNSYNKF